MVRGVDSSIQKPMVGVCSRSRQGERKCERYKTSVVALCAGGGSIKGLSTLPWVYSPLVFLGFSHVNHTVSGYRYDTRRRRQAKGSVKSCMYSLLAFA
jgi:hypothetical protein